MTLVLISTDIAKNGIGFGAPIDDSDIYLASGTTILSQNSDGLVSADNFCDFWVDGTAAGFLRGLVLGSDIASELNTLHVGATGVLLGQVGLLAYGSSVVTNHGRIEGSQTGAELRSGSQDLDLTNQGAISGRITGLDIYSAPGGVVTVTNYGVIEGGQRAYFGADGTDTIINRGTLDGNVALGGGSDRFDNRGGEVVEGGIYGGTGNDTFQPGADAEAIFGDQDFDVIDFRSGGAVQVNLASGTGTGRAAGDSYAGIEGIRGSFTGADVLSGDGAGNSLWGHGGADQLFGAAGADALEGGLGADRLSGGTGSDGFIYRAANQGGDVLLDWDALDTIVIDRSGFGLGGSAGVIPAALFHQGATNAAASADDRFILRLGDKTLWFDPDGTGSAAAVKLADLPNNATLISADIVLI